MTTTTNAEVLKLIRMTMLKVIDLRKAKSAEYSEDNDALVAVRQVARRTGQTVQMVLLTFLLKHMDAVERYVRHDDVARAKKTSEPIEGRIDDAIVYLCLLKVAISEKRSGKEYGD